MVEKQGVTVQHLIKSLGTFLGESRAKKVRKRRVRKRADEKVKIMARQIGVAMKHRVLDIEKLLPIPWKFSSPLLLDRVYIEKFGEVSMENQIDAEYGYPIKIEDGDPDLESSQRRGRGKPSFATGNDATADFVISFVPSDDGNGWWCSAAVSGLDPPEDGPGVVMDRPIKLDELRVEAEWKRGKNAFDPDKDIWPLIKVVMKELEKQMPEYDEVEFGYGMSQTDLYGF